MIEEYWSKSDEELFMLLGADLLGEGLGLSPEDEEGYRRFGKEWFAGKRRELQRKICHDERLQPFLGTSGSDRFIDATTIYEVLQHIDSGGPVASAVLAVLIARVGLGAFCENAPAPR